MGRVGRPNRQAQRREEILDAAIALIERNDLTTFRIADVAAELNLTPNAVRYYFREMDQLLSALAQRSDSKFYDDRLAVVKRTEDARDQIAFMIAAGLPSGPEDAEWRSIWRAVLAAGFVLDRRPDVQHIFHRQVDLYAQILDTGSAAGIFTLTSPARDIAMTLMAMEDYLGYRIVARDPDLDRPTALRLMRGYAELATGAPLPVTV
ncbi:TetR/AcrR family transcriptional regulator [Mycolicibacterium boenickei]|uniref:TetR family transcriptional regulator n=1 Tax=Mycolicibacterium boenickei TaxID=146017 RepID=A0AAX2ZTX3_9MYCO|nr:TetR/AcrR family transcriptional regulator [Mycolicibacterium boenickei]PEG62383.1 TetR family transcriptional regulator [Mycolicibacterium boenickei]UNB98633.1 TetR/AcrR family transcriptional regulator [Mycolicibacterium boenickei]BBX94478.1 TetR family transcriptional regulator [Mycolicibacterium boenickei]